MRTVVEIYKKYRIPTIVQKHQLRVAAVGKILADRISDVEASKVILTGLFHDMGNILKMDLAPNAGLSPFLAPDTLDQLVKIKNSFLNQYGADEHDATMKIGEEIGLTDKILAMIDNMRFSRTAWVLTEAPFEMKIIKYADLRVSPYGIVPMHERLDEARGRYRGKKFDTGDVVSAHKSLKRTEAQCFALEKVVSEKADVDPAVLTEASAAPIIEELRAYKV